MGDCMKKLYGKLVCCIIASSLVAGCDSAIEVTKEKEICKIEEVCTQIGDKRLQKVYKKIEGLSELEKVEDYDIEEYESMNMKEAEQKKEEE